MDGYKPTSMQQNQFIWKAPLPCMVEFGYELRRIGLSYVVDLGCRVGRNALALSQIGLNVTALDASKEHLQIVEGEAYQKGLEIKTVCNTSTTLPFENESVHAFVTATAIHHLKPSESKKLVDEIHRSIVPGGRVLVAVLSTEDYRYGTGEKIDENTFSNTSGPELTNVHQFFTTESLLSLFDAFTPECTPYIVPSTFVMNTGKEQKQGKLLVGKFVKGYMESDIVPDTINLTEKLGQAKRSIEMMFSYPNLKETQFSNSCIQFLGNLTSEELRDVYCQCVIIGNQPIDTVPLLQKLKKLEGNKHFSAAYSEQSIEAIPLEILIIDGIEVYSSTHFESPNSIIMDNNSKYINMFRQLLWAYWKKSNILFDGGKKIWSNSEKLGVLENKKNNNIKSNVEVIDFKCKRSQQIKVGVSQLDLTGILSFNKVQLLESDIMKLPNIIELILLKAANSGLKLLLLPELSGDKMLNDMLQHMANKHNMVIIGGSYYNDNRINCCPVAIPGFKEPYVVEKIHPSPLEISPNKDAGVIEGTKVIVFKNTIAGSFAVLICADFLNDALVEEVCNKDIDFLCVVSMNNDSPRFFKKMNSKCENYQPGIYILYSNCLFSNSGFEADGMSSIFGFMDKLYLSKLNRSENNHPYQISSFSKFEEGLLIADMNIDERRPAIGGVDRKPNILGIEKQLFE